MTFALVTILSLMITFELMARLWYQMKLGMLGSALWTPALGRYLSPALGLYEYHLWDGNRGVWVLKPGFTTTLPQSIENARSSGRFLLLRYLERRRQNLEIPDDKILFEINRDGFKGPEIDQTHSRPRILTIGDSCTFGTPFDELSYPRTLERELRRRGIDVEVINGGVEGYSPAKVLARIDDFKRLKPELTILYIGWNALYFQSKLERGFSRHLYGIRLLQAAYARLKNKRTALAAYRKVKHPDRNALTVKNLDGWVPPFIEDVDRIIEEMHPVSGRILLATIPGLYRTSEEPTPRALEVGHLPVFTDNPFVLAKMTERYNSTLRERAKSLKVGLVDLEPWSQRTLQPLDKYFVDSVHLNEEGQQMIGIYLADLIQKSGWLKGGS